MLMVDKKVILSYNGHFKFETIQFLIYKAKKEMDAMGTDIPIKKKVVNIMVECLENIHKHGNSLPEGEFEPEILKKYTSQFIFEIQGEDYFIRTGNIILNSTIENIKRKVDQVNQLDREGLKKLYEQVITKTTISKKGGAGLGIIDMALKSNNKIEYNFEKINKQLSYYEIKLKISKKKK